MNLAGITNENKLWRVHRLVGVKIIALQMILKWFPSACRNAGATLVFTKAEGNGANRAGRHCVNVAKLTRGCQILFSLVNYCVNCNYKF
jgi:hypothetical protein